MGGSFNEPEFKMHESHESYLSHLTMADQVCMSNFAVELNGAQKVRPNRRSELKKLRCWLRLLWLSVGPFQ